MKKKFLSGNSSLLAGLLAWVFAVCFSACTPTPEQTVMQRIQEGTPSITEIVSETTTEPFDGIILTDARLKMRDSLDNHLFVIQVDLRKHLTLRPSSPEDQPFSKKNGLQNMKGQAEAAQKNGHEVYLGVNGDVFGYYEGLDYFSPRGVHIVDGKDISTSRGDENVIYVKKDGSVHLEKYETFLQEEEQVRQAMGGWHTLVWDGEPHSAEEYTTKHLTLLNPRTFFGLSEDAKTVCLFVVDGRQPGYSQGILMEDMVNICLSMDCWRACNLDGGGSTTLVMREEKASSSDRGTESADGEVSFKLLNTPSDLIFGKRTPRWVANGLLVVAD